ncbi:MAG: hypothetical protein V7K23_02515 [Nostoc sp.]
MYFWQENSDRSPSSPGSDRTPHTTKLESKMLTIAYERHNNHFTFYTQIENRID